MMHTTLRIFSALCAFAVALCLSAQAPPPPAPPAPSTPAQSTTEVSTQDATPTFSSRVNLVPITVVVRDLKGHAVGNLTKDDFRVLDNGRPQVITRFAVERPAAPIALGQAETDPDKPAPDASKPEAPPATTVIANRFLIYLFDDVHLGFDDLARSRDSALTVIATSLEPNERIAIYTTSGQNMLDFTDDAAKLQAALMQLKPAPNHTVKFSQCPPISEYVADQVENHNDPTLLQMLVAETYSCSNFDPTTTPAATVQQMVRFAATEMLQLSDHDTRLVLSTLRNAVSRLATMPGQRSIILSSPGFLTSRLNQDLTELVNRAVRANVVIGSLDARGLWTDPGLAASEHGTFAANSPRLATYTQAAASAQSDVLAEVAAGTGGTFFQNSNDLQAGFRALAAAPEYIYVLGFAPSNMKSDGSYHRLKVTLADPKQLTLQARRGYYAPKRETDPAELARQELEDAAFSRDVVQDFPTELHTQFFKPTDDTAKLSVLARIAIRQLHFRKQDGRNCNTVHVFALLFDPNGNYLNGFDKVLNLRLTDETLANRTGSGVTVKSVFDVKPGSYVIRLVVQDGEERRMATANGAIEIP